MPTTLDPTSPVQANHRFLKALLNSNFGNQVLHIPVEYDRMCKVFEKLGGNWEGIFNGNSKDINKLKEVVQHAFENGHLSKKEEWIQKEDQDQR